MVRATTVMSSRRSPARPALAAAAILAMLAGCAAEPSSGNAPLQPDAVRAHIAALMPPAVADRAGWSVDIYAGFAALHLVPSHANVCAVLAVAEQESSYQADPAVPHLGQVVRAEIDRRAERMGVPRLLLQGALLLRSPDSRSYAERIDAARTEKELSDIFVDFVAAVPLGERLFGGYNPVRTGGPMQVSVDYAERHIKGKAYPYRMAGSVRDEVFSRRGGLYFGIAHLLDYPAGYEEMIFRFADYNAGHYASRNAAFQSALGAVSGRPLDLDGDLIRHDGGGGGAAGATELAARALAPRLEMSEAAIHQALEQDESAGFSRSRLYARVFELAEQHEQRRLPRAVLPHIALHSPKITRPLTTEWFAHRVDERYRRCLARPG